MARKKQSQGKILQIPFNFTPRLYQLELFQAMDGKEGIPKSGKRRALLRWHRRAGKDKACWCFLLKEAAQVVGNYFYIFPTAVDARRALWENIDKDGFRLLDHLPSEFIRRSSNQEMLLELINGSTIRVLGFDKDPDSIRGIAAKGAVFSEFAYSDPDSYKVMIPAIRETDGWIIFNSTPNGRNHFFDMWENVSNSKDWFCSYRQTYWADQPGYTGLIKPEAFLSIIHEEGLSQDDVEREYGCSFNTSMQGSYYADYVEYVRNTSRIVPNLYDENLPVTTYWDIGIDDTDAIWFGQRKGSLINFIDYYEGNGLGTNALAQILSNKRYRYDWHYLPHDAGHRKKGQEVITTADELESSFNAYGVEGKIEIVPRTNSVQASIQAVRKRFAFYKFDSIKCEEGIKHLELYHRKYDKRRRVYLQEPVHDEHSHAADAFRMEAESGDVRNDPFYRPGPVKVLRDYDIWDFD